MNRAATTHQTTIGEYASRYTSGFSVARFSAGCSCGWALAGIATKRRAITKAQAHAAAATTRSHR